MKSADQWETESISELENLLRKELNGENDPPLSVDDILYNCELLVQKSPVRTDPQAAWRTFKKYYLDDEQKE